MIIGSNKTYGGIIMGYGIGGKITVLGIEGEFDSIEAAKAAMCYERKEFDRVIVKDVYDDESYSVKGGVCEVWRAPEAVRPV